MEISFLKDFADLAPILITLALSFLIGLEREEHHQGQSTYNFGGVRTFPIIGLCGYLTSKLSLGQPLVLVAGIVFLGSMLWLSYKKKLEISSSAGMTSEISGFFTFLMGALIERGYFWNATALAVIVLLLLELKVGLETLAKKIPTDEIFTVTRFLLISAVILPIVPNQDFTEFHLNPYKTWLIVVAISGLSYLSYCIGKFVSSKNSILLSAILGGIYSSTATTLVFAKHSDEDSGGGSNSSLVGAIVIASGLMYFRLVILIGLFNKDLSLHLAPPFLALGIITTLGGYFWMNQGRQKNLKTPLKPHNPLELQTAIVFALMFSVISILTTLAKQHMGSAGIFGLSFITGLTDVDPFVMSMTQSSEPLSVAASSIIIAVSANNLVKGLYAFIWGSSKIKKPAVFALLALGLLTSLCLFI